jgi:hypothetical protein
MAALEVHRPCEKTKGMEGETGGESKYAERKQRWVE